MFILSSAWTRYRLITRSCQFLNACLDLARLARSNNLWLMWIKTVQQLPGISSNYVDLKGLQMQQQKWPSSVMSHQQMRIPWSSSCPHFLDIRSVSQCPELKTVHDNHVPLSRLLAKSTVWFVVRWNKALDKLKGIRQMVNVDVVIWAQYQLLE